MKLVGCIQIIKDDFNNVLIMKKKAKKGTTSKWVLLNQKIRGKENEEKCLARAAKDVLKTIVFDNKEFKEYTTSEEECVKVYIGNLKERFILDKTYDEAKWINKNRLDEHEFEELDRKILLDYFD
ncbi:MAG: hypothetical protein E7208_02495 [Clostridium butyricum]|nr:hypothetical protein [Clostridium butyricum]